MDPTTGPIDITTEQTTEPPIRGAEAIAEYIFGDRASKRKIYYLAECSKIPIYRLGSTLCLRKSAYAKWIKDQETRAVSNVKRIG